MLHSSVMLAGSLKYQSLGLFASNVIMQGETVWTLDEETCIYTRQEVHSLPPKKLEDFYEYGFQIGKNKFCNPSDLSRYMNHSCSPNCKWGPGNTSIVAASTIKKEDELTYDYLEIEDDLPFSFLCKCGSLFCRILVSNTEFINSNENRFLDQ